MSFLHFSALLVLVLVASYVAADMHVHVHINGGDSSSPNNPNSFAAAAPAQQLGGFKTCDTACKEAGWAGGNVVGTAPICTADCKDCNEKCIPNWSEDSGCWTGNKVCCCFSFAHLTAAVQSVVDQSTADASSDVKSNAEPNTIVPCLNVNGGNEHQPCTADGKCLDKWGRPNGCFCSENDKKKKMCYRNV
eukprot:TRINITY_DN517_c0_g2_i1.p1 TRINITY_DN517_c0_g2~~TRINITY_DN517_c0_g2_i1.p1  ORF type:complete len:191 (-),score=23.64 TRINITY_DN517_c0_g2_i1:6-578(-)